MYLEGTASLPRAAECRASCRPSRERLAAPRPIEVVTTNPNVEGEATALYLAKPLRPLGVKITRIARGPAVGGDLEYADRVTLSKAPEGRREIG